MIPTTTDEYLTACALLDRWAERAAERGAPVWLQIRSAGDDSSEAGEASEVVRPQGLLGVVVGPEWDAVAVVGTGRLRLLDEAHEPPASLASGLAGGLAMACVVSRRGRTGYRMRLPSGEFFDQVPEEGFMLDILRRSLQLPTAVPAVSTAPLQLTAWLGSILQTPVRDRARMGWARTLRCHPALADRPDLDVSEAEELLRTVSSQNEWEAMRRVVAAGLDTGTTPPPKLAAWMDEGMFARWVLRELPPLDAILPAVRRRLEPGAYRKLAHLVLSLDERTSVR